MRMSTSAARRRNTSCPPGFEMSTAMLSLARLYAANEGRTPPLRPPHFRNGSPPSTISTFQTVAPRSARSMLAYGPLTKFAISRTRIPARGPAIERSFLVSVKAPEPGSLSLPEERVVTLAPNAPVVRHSRDGLAVGYEQRSIDPLA